MALGYIDVKVIKTQEVFLREKIGYAGVMPLDDNGYHCTLIYDRRDSLSEPLTDIRPNEVFVGTVIGFKELGEPNEDESVNAFVLMLSSGELALEHERLVKAGYQHSFPEYIPHISLAYDLTLTQCADLRRHLADLVGTNIYLTNETLEYTKA